MFLASPGVSVARVFVFAWVAALGWSGVASANPAGQAIYAEQCARCHGPAGAGTKKAPQPLVGDKSLAQLTRVVQQTMPESDPGSLSDAEARDVTTYLYNAFYSPEAQARVNPPRVDLARLTVRQYRNAVADLVGSFRPSLPADNRRGLRGDYFPGRDIRTDRRLIERIDERIQFDFGGDAPSGDIIKGRGEFNAQQFSARWEGSVLAPETGVYDFVVRTDHAARFFINDLRAPLIDAMIKSGTDTEYRASLYLLGGRTYSIRLEFFKNRQLGVAALQKPLPPAPAFVTLAWKPPHGPEEAVPSRYLFAGRSPEVMSIETPFPPDDRSYGWERGTTVSKEWFAATTSAAMDVAGYVSVRLNELAGTIDGAADRPAKLRTFATQFAERAFRRPLTDVEKRVYVESQFADGVDPAVAVKRVVLRVLNAPAFLYVGGERPGDAYDVASRLAFTLWDAPPDRQLLEAAASGKLKDPAEVRRQAERMIGDLRARAKLRDFMLAWLHVDHQPELVKDAKRFPTFDAATAADLRASLELFLDDVVWSDASDFRQLLLSDEMYLNGRLSAIYGGGLPADADFKKVKLDAGRRAGVVTHPYLLSVFAYAGESSPIHRGVYLARGVLGVSLRPPQEAFVPLSADQHPDLTTRQRVTKQTSATACVGCHGIINPLGFTLENFDAIGRHREKDAGKLIDVSGSFETRAGSIAQFKGAKELAAFLAGSEDVHGAFATQLFQHLVKQPARAYGLDRPAALRQTFREQNWNIRKLAIEAAVIAAKGPTPGSPTAAPPPRR